MNELAILLQSHPDPEMIKRIVMIFFALIPIIIVVSIALVMVPCWFILKKAGMSPWLSLLCILPSLGTLVLLYVLAFAEWKVAPIPQTAWQPPQPPYPPPPLPPRV